MIREHQRIVLTAEVPEEKLKAGDIGTVVHIHGQGEAFEVEIIALNGDTVTVVTLPAGKIRPIAEKEIPHARHLAG